MSASETKSYLGDGVYVEIDRDYYVKLTTEDGIEATNTVYLEPPVWASLIAWYERTTHAHGLKP